jgi:uncharacterized protein (UPF0332 family)
MTGNREALIRYRIEQADEGRGPSKHSGAVALFDGQFVKTELFGKDFSRWLHEAFDLRQRSD